MIFFVIFLLLLIPFFIRGFDLMLFLIDIFTCFFIPATLTIIAESRPGAVVDETALTLPRQSIPIHNIVALHCVNRMVGLAPMRDVSIEYLDERGALKQRFVMAFSTFGRAEATKMINQPTNANPAIKIDPEVLEMIKGSGPGLDASGKRTRVSLICIFLGLALFFGGMIAMGFIYGFSSNPTALQFNILMIPLLLSAFGMGYLFGGKKAGWIVAGCVALLLVSAGIKGQQNSSSAQSDSISNVASSTGPSSSISSQPR